MKKLYTKFPLILLTLLNYAPYTYPTKKKPDTVKSTKNTTNKKTSKKKSKSIKHVDTAVTNEAAAIESATELITGLTNAQVDAQALINDFINAEVPESFETLFDSYFSKDVLKNNEEQLYSLFSQLPLSPAMHNSTSPFAAEEFEKQLQATLELTENSMIEITCADADYKSIVPLSSFAALGCNKIFKATINTEHNILFLHFGNDQVPNLSYIGLINTKNLVSMLIPSAPENEIKEIGLLSDCSQLGIMRMDDMIFSYNLPTDLINFVPSFKQKAFITYIDEQINMLGRKIVQNEFSNDMIKAYSRLPLDVVYKLALLIHTNKDLLPESLHDILCNEKINSLQQILAISSNAKFVADTLNIDIDTLADKMASNEITQEQVLAILSPDQSPVDDQTLGA